MKLLMQTLILLSFLGACSGKQEPQDQLEATGDSINKFGENMRQEACEMIDGKLECAVEKAKWDMDKAVN